MFTKIKKFITPQLRTDLPIIRPGDTVRVHQKIKEVVKKTKKGGAEKKERIQVFEGLVIARKHGNEIGATITVRKVISGVGVERIFPIHLPIIEKIEITKRGKVRRAKLYYMRVAKGKRARLKQIDIPESDITSAIITKEKTQETKEIEPVDKINSEKKKIETVAIADIKEVETNK